MRRRSRGINSSKPNVRKKKTPLAPSEKPRRRSTRSPRAATTPSPSSSKTKQSPPTTKNKKTKSTPAKSHQTKQADRDVARETSSGRVDVGYVPVQGTQANERARSVAISAVKQRRKVESGHEKYGPGDVVMPELMGASPSSRQSHEITEEVLDGSRSDEDTHKSVPMVRSRKQSSQGDRRGSSTRNLDSSPMENITEEVLEESDPRNDVGCHHEKNPLATRKARTMERRVVEQPNPPDMRTDKKSIPATPVHCQLTPKHSPPSIGLHAMKFATDLSISSDQESPEKQSKKSQEQMSDDSLHSGDESLSSPKQTEKAILQNPSPKKNAIHRKLRTNDDASKGDATAPSRHLQSPNTPKSKRRGGKHLGKRPRVLCIQKKISDPILDDSIRASPSLDTVTPKQSALAASIVGRSDATIAEALKLLEEMIESRQRRGRPSRSATKEREQLENRRNLLQKELNASLEHQHSVASPPLLRLNNSRHMSRGYNILPSSTSEPESHDKDVPPPAKKARKDINEDYDMDKRDQESRSNLEINDEHIDDGAVFVPSPKRIANVNMVEKTGFMNKNARVSPAVAGKTPDTVGAKAVAKETLVTTEHDDVIIYEDVELVHSSPKPAALRPASGCFSRFKARKSPSVITRSDGPHPSPIPPLLVSTDGALRQEREGIAFPRKTSAKTCRNVEVGVSKESTEPSETRSSGTINLSSARRLRAVKQPRQLPARQIREHTADSGSHTSRGTLEKQGYKGSLLNTGLDLKRKERIPHLGAPENDIERTAKRRKGGDGDWRVGGSIHAARTLPSVKVRVALNERSTPIRDVVDVGSVEARKVVGDAPNATGRAAVKNGLKDISSPGRGVAKTNTDKRDEKVFEKAPRAEILVATPNVSNIGGKESAESDRVKKLEAQVAQLESDLDKRNDELREKRAAMTGFLAEIKELEARLARRSESAEIEHALQRVAELEGMVAQRDEELQRYRSAGGSGTEEEISQLEEVVVDPTGRLAELESGLRGRGGDGGEGNGHHTASWLQDPERASAALRGVLEANRELQRQLYAARQVG